MNDLIKQVTPLTVGIIWILKDDLTTTNPHYGEIDYLLDGLLTSNLKVGPISTGLVIIGQNFNHPLYVLIVREARSAQIESYVSLFKNSLVPENDILVIDEADGLKNLKQDLKEISHHLRSFLT